MYSLYNYLISLRTGTFTDTILHHLSHSAMIRCLFDGGKTEPEWNSKDGTVTLWFRTRQMQWYISQYFLLSLQDSIN
jgi:hypothetical protein